MIFSMSPLKSRHQYYQFVPIYTLKYFQIDCIGFGSELKMKEQKLAHVSKSKTYCLIDLLSFSQQNDRYRPTKHTHSKSYLNSRGKIYPVTDLDKAIVFFCCCIQQPNNLNKTEDRKENEMRSFSSRFHQADLHLRHLCVSLCVMLSVNISQIFFIFTLFVSLFSVIWCQICG